MSEQEKNKEEQHESDEITDPRKIKIASEDLKKTGHTDAHKDKTGKSHKKSAPEDVLESVQHKLEEINDKYLRLYSEFDNYRKRTLREKTELTKTASAEVILDLLPVLDDFERAIRNSESTNNTEAIREGEKLILTKLKRTLELKGLQEMKTIGEPFDTDLHDAVTNVPAPADDMKGKVIDEIQKGYLLNGKVIRYARVVVGT